MSKEMKIITTLKGQRRVKEGSDSLISDFALAYTYIKSAKILGENIDPKEIIWYENRLSRSELEKANAMIASLTKKIMNSNNRVELISDPAGAGPSAAHAER